MIILITDVIDAEPSNIVTFEVVDGSPSIEEVNQLLNHELDNLVSLLYSSKSKQGQFTTAERVCIRGEHFNAIEHTHFYH